MSGKPKEPKNWVSVPTQTKKINLPHHRKAASKPGGMPTSPTHRQMPPDRGRES